MSAYLLNIALSYIHYQINSSVLLFSGENAQIKVNNILFYTQWIWVIIHSCVSTTWKGKKAMYRMGNKLWPFSLIVSLSLIYFNTNSCFVCNIILHNNRSARVNYLSISEYRIYYLWRQKDWAYVQMFCCFWRILEVLSPFCGATDTPVLDFWWHLLGFKARVSRLIHIRQWYTCYAFPDSPLLWHLLTSWWPVWLPSYSLPHICEQALVGLETRTYRAATHSKRSGSAGICTNVFSAPILFFQTQLTEVRWCTYSPNKYKMYTSVSRIYWIHNK